MTTTQINCFISAAEAKSFTVAANKLYMSQSALSRSVAALETEIGFTLFERNKNSLELTSGGVKFYKWACNASVQLKDLIEDVRNGESGGSIVIGYVKNEQLTEQFQSRVMKFRELNPCVDLKFVMHDSARDIINALRNGSIDVAFMIESALNYVRGIAHYTMGESRYVLAVSMLHPLWNSEYISFAELKNECFITISHDESPAMSDGLQSISEHFGFNAKIKEKRNINEVIDSVINGEGIVLVYEGHAAVFNRMLHIIRLKENFPVNICFAINPNNNNPNINLFKSIFISG